MSFDQQGIHFEGSSTVLTGSIPLTEFEVTQGSVGEEGGYIWIAKNGSTVTGNGFLILVQSIVLVSLVFEFNGSQLMLG